MTGDASGDPRHTPVKTASSRERRPSNGPHDTSTAISFDVTDLDVGTAVVFEDLTLSVVDVSQRGAHVTMTMIVGVTAIEIEPLPPTPSETFPPSPLTDSTRAGIAVAPGQCGARTGVAACGTRRGRPRHWKRQRQ